MYKNDRLEAWKNDIRPTGQRVVVKLVSQSDPMKRSSEE
jgi:hypothetical protein